MHLSRLPFTIHRLPYISRLPFTVYRKWKTDHGKRTGNGLRKTDNSSGDTIVEVIISIAILGLVLSIAYFSSSNSLQAGRDAAARSQAVALAQKQLELVKEAVNNPASSRYDEYIAKSGPFCIANDGSPEDPNSGGYCDNSNIPELGQYKVALSYTGAKSLFTVTVKWTGARNTEQQLTSNYRAVGLASALAVTTLNADSPVADGSRWQATMRGRINPGGTTATDCYFEYAIASTFSEWGTSPSPAGYQRVGCSPGPPYTGAANINISGTITADPGIRQVFHLCAANDTGLICGANIFWDPPTEAPPSVNLCANALPPCSSPHNVTVANGASVTLRWNSANVTPPCTASGDWSGPKDGSGSQTYAPLSGPATYTYNLSCNGAGGSSATATAIITVEATAPTVITGSATAITASSATLNGSVNPNGANVTTCRFDYGPTTSYGSSATCSPMPGSGNSPVAVAANISGLNQSTTYNFRLCATNIGGSQCGSNASFTTLSASPPSVSLSPTSSTYYQYLSPVTLSWSSTNATSCPSANPAGWPGSTASSGSRGVSPGATTSYTITCSGPGGSTTSNTATVNFVARPGCSASAGGYRSGEYVYISGGGSGCAYYYDSVVGWNGGFADRQYYSPGTFCHTQYGGADPWGFYAEQTWCG